MRGPRIVIDKITMHGGESLAYVSDAFPGEIRFGRVHLNGTKRGVETYVPDVNMGKEEMKALTALVEQTRDPKIAVSRFLALDGIKEHVENHGYDIANLSVAMLPIATAIFATLGG